MRAEHRVVLLIEEPEIPIPTRLGCHEHHLGTEATARDCRGIWGLCQGQCGTAKQEKSQSGKEGTATGVPCP